MNKRNLIIGAVLGLLAIIIGAFGSHGLKTLIDTDAQNTFEIGVRYQMYHALFLLALGSMKFINHRTQQIIGSLVLFGIILFSGSIYGLATNALFSFDFKVIGFVTPIGGLFLIFAWLILLINFLKMKRDKS
ncbi:DUF423 domain-containing protein [Psychroserpens sp.]|uniref:DUF423 domain-containing protein n=1 Tax=Psychroserpens sp. TaxID=2020870 RepID=UPI001B280443|nr:DUF423 domain-containing protein [Psychroserpens sp.]MBO6605645.1 DUF423 domain-containing protein [Psychroserpens sp.]MBO6630691.1 DUF423 domain-containing protein [Psychroserpens sp.]MBO6653546.1 DUF423 domain-containing protein [Psychroserpens sp.]MBO6681867.1 DUF423 domain-containing protein [Psychroserpens sp.]MBO6749019.1 DUF423 domain-containing protein [Psychroserpens sp.]